MPGRPGMLRAWRAAGILRDIDVYATEAAIRASGSATDIEAAAMALASRAVGEGHVCLELAAVTEVWLRSLQIDTDIPLPEGTATVCAAIRALPAGGSNSHYGHIPVSIPASAFALRATADRGEAGTTNTVHPVSEAFVVPLSGGFAHNPEEPGVFVLAAGRLYLRRFYHDERLVARRLVEMAASGDNNALTPELEARLQCVFPGEGSAQQAAARGALTRRLTLITGGPGTGKTYTAARILALLTHQHDGERPLRVRLSAPTGKAAARLGESIRQARAAMPPGSFRDGMIIDEACTLDRLLGRRRQASAYRHDAECPLEVDVVMVDEASMVDLAKMARLLDALPSHARLVLLGDRHQLAAVAPGSVLAAIGAAPAIAPAVVELTESRRFAPGGAIARFSAAVNAANNAEAATQAVALLAPSDVDTEDAVGFVETPAVLKAWRNGVDLRFAQAVLRGYRDFLDAQMPAAAFAALATFRVLCALRRGPLGAEQVNALIEEILSWRELQMDKLPPDCHPARTLAPSGAFYSHRVVMVTQNDYATGLFNGDVGIVLPAADDPQRLAVYFEQPSDADGEHYRRVPCHLLPTHETAFAITVHKSQGSEFGRVLVLLPPSDSPVVTRELIYTAVTRTRSGVTIWGGRESLTAAIQRTVRRFSGLFD